MVDFDSVSVLIEDPGLWVFDLLVKVIYSGNMGLEFLRIGGSLKIFVD